MRQKTSFDSMDIVLSVALAGGFFTGNWIPAVILFSITATAAIITNKETHAD